MLQVKKLVRYKFKLFTKFNYLKSKNHRCTRAAMATVI